VFKWLAPQAGRAELEMLRTFNCGVGMVAIVKTDAVARVMEVLASSGESVSYLGHVVEAAGEQRVVYDNHLDLRL
jgi:phosphoribosylformylglycinamidine cyclo-ligase